MAKPEASVSIIVVTYFTGDALWKCLQSCVDSSAREIIVVNNGNTAVERENLRKFEHDHPQVQLLDDNKNTGFSKACNRGAAHASGAHLLFLNPDGILHQRALHELVDAMRSAKSPAVVGGRLLNTDGSEQRGARRGVLTPWSALVSMSGLTRFEKYSPLFADMHWEGRPLPAGPQPVPAISGACMMFRSADFHQIGGLDEGYFLHVEDLDICRRIRKQAGDVLFVPTAEITHIGSTSKVNPFSVNWTKARGLVRYFYRFSANPAQKIVSVLLAPLIIGAIMTRSVLIFLLRR